VIVCEPRRKKKEKKKIGTVMDFFHIVQPVKLKGKKKRRRAKAHGRACSDEGSRGKKKEAPVPSRGRLDPRQRGGGGKKGGRGIALSGLGFDQSSRGKEKREKNTGPYTEHYPLPHKFKRGEEGKPGPDPPQLRHRSCTEEKGGKKGGSRLELRQ